ncbi:PorT family protein [Flavobacteriaceae bacterium]|nr:PorT family protein [Flavobacteriaceae bacterium]
MNLKLNFLFLFISLGLFAQEDVFVDENYLEDQFYIGIQYNNTVNNPSGLSTVGIPYSFNGGFIKDIPLNKRRNIAFGIGAGYSYDLIRPNVNITQSSDNFTFDIDDTLSTYSFATHNLEIPLEFRWRTSTATNSSFWRIYTGISYIKTFDSTIKLNNGDAGNYSNISELNTKNFSIYSSLGYGTWNFHIKYYLNSYFKNGTLDSNGNNLNFNQLKIGVIFYIL